MPEVDLRVLWSLGRAEFGVWFAGAALMGTTAFMRCATRLTPSRLAAAAIIATVVSWLLVAVVPVALAGSLVMEDVFFAGRSNVVSWSFGVLISAVLATGSGSATLVLLRQKLSGRALAALFFVNLLCVVLAVCRMWAYVQANPAVA